MKKTFKDIKTYTLEENISDNEILYSVIISNYKWKKVYVQHKDRDTWEIPWWHRESWESILECAKRELFEETWAKDFKIEHIWYWSLVNEEWKKSFWAIFFADILSFWNKPNSEISKIDFFSELPENMTYPNVHTVLLEYTKKLVSFSFK